MCSFTTRDGVEIYYKDWGTGQPIVFSHGWPLSSDAFEDQMVSAALRTIGAAMAVPVSPGTATIWITMPTTWRNC